MADSISNYVTKQIEEPNSKVLLVKGFQGIGKTQISLDVAKALWTKEKIRPIYSAPRHDLLTQAIEMVDLKEDGNMTHILPRAPRSEEEEEEEPPCPYWKIAEIIARKRHSVVKNLCLTQACDKQPEFCPYYIQYHSSQPVGIVHDILPVPKLMDYLTKPCHDEDETKHFVIFDEPNIDTFIEKVEITSEDISLAIDTSWNVGQARFLSALQSALGILNSQMERDSKIKLLGKEALDALLDALDGEISVDTLIKDAEEKKDIGMVAIRCEGPVIDDPYDPDKKLRIWLDSDHNEEFTLNKKFVSLINGSLVMVQKWYAENLGILSAKEKIDEESNRKSFASNVTPSLCSGQALERSEGSGPIVNPSQAQDQSKSWVDHPESDKDPYQEQAENLPLNFIDDLLKILQEKTQNLVIHRGFGDKAYLQMNLKRTPQLSSEIPLVVLDPNISSDLLSVLCDRKVEVWEAPAVTSDTEIVQIVDGLYGISTLWNKKGNHPKRSFFRLYPLLKKEIEEAPAHTLLVTWKLLANWLKEEQNRGELPEGVRIAHYGALEGLNDYNDFEKVILFGAPQIPHDQVQELAHAIYPDADINPTSTKVWRSYQYTDVDGREYEVEVRDYVDPKMKQIARLFREAELVQCARRIRDILSKGKKIVLFTNLPVSELPPTRLATVNELKEAYGIDDDKEQSAKQFVEAQVRAIIERGIRAGMEDGTLDVQFTVKYIKSKIMDGQDRSKEILEQCNPSTPLEISEPEGTVEKKSKSLTGSTLERYIRSTLVKLAPFYALDSKKITIGRGASGRGTVRLRVYATGEVDEKAARREYLNYKWKVSYEGAVFQTDTEDLAASIAALFFRDCKNESQKVRASP